VSFFFIDTLGEERDDREKPSGIGPKFSEQWGGKGKFDRGREAGVLYAKHPWTLSLPFTDQLICVLFIVLGDSGE